MVGDRVEVIDPRNCPPHGQSCFAGRRGVLVATRPNMVLLEGETKALHFGDEALLPISSEPNIGGAE